jgi:PAT family beta-lactamase induction signal transducer AmpG
MLGAQRMAAWSRQTVEAFGVKSAGTLFFFGFSCGLPFLLVGSTLAIWLREAGYTLSLIGFVSYASLFYVFKFLWSPILDRYHAPFFARLGRRRSWLLTTQLLMLISLLSIAALGPQTWFVLFVFLVALTALAGATQDAIVDAFRIEAAPINAQGALVATYSIGYRLGLIAGGAGALYLADFFSWSVAYISMALLLVLPIIANLRATEPQIVSQNDAEPPPFILNFISPLNDFFARFGWLLGAALLIFVGCFKFPDQMLGVIASPFYLDSGFSKSDIATVSKFYGVWIGLAGVMLGGIAITRVAIKKLLLIAAIAVALSNLLFVVMALYPGHYWAFVLTISGDNFAQGFSGAVLVTYMSSLTSSRHTATQYALLSSLANLPGKFVGGLSGYIVQSWGYTHFFIFSSFSLIPTLLLLLWLWPKLSSPEPEIQKA